MREGTHVTPHEETKNTIDLGDPTSDIDQYQPSTPATCRCPPAHHVFIRSCLNFNATGQSDKEESWYPFGDIHGIEDMAQHLSKHRMDTRLTMDTVPNDGQDN
jgi:hypothetical protein